MIYFCCYADYRSSLGEHPTIVRGVATKDFVPAGVGAVEVDDQGNTGPLTCLQDTHAVGTILGQDDVRPGSTKRCFVCAIPLIPSLPRPCKIRVNLCSAVRGFSSQRTGSPLSAGTPRSRLRLRRLREAVRHARG